MDRSLRFRLGAAVLALLTCLSTPIVALGHGRVHAHMATAHSPESEVHSASQPGAHAHEADTHEHHDWDDGHAAAEPQSVTADEAGKGSAESSHAEHDTAAIIESSTHEHEHGHVAFDTAASARGDSRLTSPVLAPAAEPDRYLLLAARRRIDVSAWKDSALLARPGPDTGPHAGPRAPPLR